MNNPTRILIFENDWVSGSILAEALEAEHHQVYVANDQVEMLRQITSWHPDLITTDLDSYGDGIAFCSQIRSASHAPLIVISAQVDEASKVKALDAGASDYVTKPFSMPEVAARIRSQLRRLAYHQISSRS